MTAGVAVKNFGNYGWHTYNWALAPAPALGGVVWTSCVLAPEGGPASQRALDMTATAKQAGTVSVQYGTRPGAYTAKTLPVPVAANTAATIRLTDLKPNTTYYANATWSGVVPAAAGGLAQPAMTQFGELSAATP